MLMLLRQLPGLMRKIGEEHDWLNRLLRSEQLDGIISDNRYGLWHSGVPSVILTHQAEVRTGLGSTADALLRRIHYRYLQRFDSCWIVDVAGSGSLAGRLSHPSRLPRNARYIGWLSQLSVPRSPTESYVLILLSGPEPQRSMLSDLLWKQAADLREPIVFIEGRPEAIRTEVPGHIRHIPQADASELQPLLEAARIVVCRSGYSSLMDLVLLRKRAILIPTPGQTEQEYLARRLGESGIFYTAPQARFSLRDALAAAARFPFRLRPTGAAHAEFIPVLDSWIERL